MNVLRSVFSVIFTPHNFSGNGSKQNIWQTLKIVTVKALFWSSLEAPRSFDTSFQKPLHF